MSHLHQIPFVSTLVSKGRPNRRDQLVALHWSRQTVRTGTDDDGGRCDTVEFGQSVQKYRSGIGRLAVIRYSANGYYSKRYAFDLDASVT